MSELCYNKGCNKTFDPSGDRKDDECRYHSGEPKFHDAYKIWTCCGQRSTDFTTFLSFNGCTVGRHSNDKPIINQKNNNIPFEQPKINNIPKPSVEIPRPPEDSPFESLPVKVIGGAKAKESEATNKSLNCVNHGCKTSYPSDTECRYHSGAPIFHEGSKYWSCCRRKTTDFDAFLNQKGCETGDHKWSKNDSEQKVVNWRVDWFQTSNDITISVYSKNVNDVIVECNNVIAKAKIDLWSREWRLNGIVDIIGSKVNVSPNKVEIILKKSEQKQWPKLEY